jgi:hypothetical protein
LVVRRGIRRPSHGRYLRVIDRWQRQIKESSAELLLVEQKIGETNKALRTLRAASKPAIKTCSHLPDDVAARSDLRESLVQTLNRTNGEINTRPKEGRILFLEFFHQLVSENLDPRMVAVLEKDAHSLVDAYRATHPMNQQREV